MSSMNAFKPANSLTFETVQSDLVRFRLYLKANQSFSLAVDLSHVILCDSAGLAFLVEAKRLSLLSNQTLQIMGMPSKVQMLAEFCGVLVLLMGTHED